MDDFLSFISWIFRAHIVTVKMFKSEASILVKYEVFNCQNAGMVLIFFDSS